MSDMARHREKSVVARLTRLAVLLVMSSALPSATTAQEKESGMIDPADAELYSFTMKTIDGKMRSLAEYRGSVLVLVNVASECGYTPQYKDLEALFRTYEDRGLRILGFPANNFGGQEPGSDEEIKAFCEGNFNVTFDLFSKISVKGEDIHPLYHYLTHDSPAKGEVRWNFQKYLVDRRGRVVAVFPSKVKPFDDDFLQLVESLLRHSD
jgi:glutathione peroxidase